MKHAHSFVKGISTATITRCLFKMIPLFVLSLILWISCIGGKGSNPMSPSSPPPPPRTLPPVARGIWISPEELTVLPINGSAWDKLKKAADGDLGEPNMAGYTANHDVNTLAVALVYARTGEASYRQKAAEAIKSAIGTEHTGCHRPDCSKRGGLAVTISRNLVSYVIAADLIELGDYDAQLDTKFRSWIDGLRYVQWEDLSLIANDERRVNNHGRVAGASRAAVAVYLKDQSELERTAQVFKGFLGDRNIYAGLDDFEKDLSWQAEPSRPVGINPVGATKNGFLIDGALPEEMRHGCPFQIPPCPTGYPWGALQGIVVEAMILYRQGYDVWNWDDQAILRMVLPLKNSNDREDFKRQNNGSAG
jgi:hypothetical protein